MILSLALCSVGLTGYTLNLDPTESQDTSCMMEVECQPTTEGSELADLYYPYDTSLVTEWPGERPSGWAYHVGTDFGVPQGTPLRATVSGTVYLTWNDGFGAYVLDIVRPDGFVVRNGHLSRMDAAHGSWVNAGDHIGLTGGLKGTTGAGLSTGPHLHWELRWNRNWSGPGWVTPQAAGAVPFPSDSNTPNTVPGAEEDEYEMANMYIYKKENGKQINAIANTVSGFFHEFESTNGEYNTNIAKTFGVVTPSAGVSVSHYNAIKSDCAKVRTNK